MDQIYFLQFSDDLNCVVGGALLPSAQAAGVTIPAGAVICTAEQCRTPHAWIIQNDALVAA